MSKTKTKPNKSTTPPEPDGVYLLKLVLFLVVGSQWLWLNWSNGSRTPLPAGLIIGLLFAMHEHFRIDRKIAYAVLLVAMLVGYVANIGLAITI